VPFRHVVFTYAFEGGPVESHVYLTVAGRLLLKYRLTIRLPVGPRERESIKVFLEQVTEKHARKAV